MKQYVQFDKRRNHYYCWWRCMECDRKRNIDRSKRRRDRQRVEQPPLKLIREVCKHGHIGSMARRYNFDNRRGENGRYYMTWYCQECTRIRDRAKNAMA